MEASEEGRLTRMRKLRLWLAGHGDMWDVQCPNQYHGTWRATFGHHVELTAPTAAELLTQLKRVDSKLRELETA